MTCECDWSFFLLILLSSLSGLYVGTFSISVRCFSVAVATGLWLRLLFTEEEALYPVQERLYRVVTKAMRKFYKEEKILLLRMLRDEPEIRLAILRLMRQSKGHGEAKIVLRVRLVLENARDERRSGREKDASGSPVGWENV